MPEKYGIENLTILFALGLEGVNVGFHWKSPEGHGAAEMLRLTDEVMALPQVEWKQLDDEIKDLSASEFDVLKALAEKKLDFPQEKARFVVKRCIFMGWKAGSLVKDAFDMASELKKWDENHPTVVEPPTYPPAPDAGDPESGVSEDSPN